jgi:hypothetical protein
MATWVSGRRRAVHQDRGVSRASRPLFFGRCDVDDTLTAAFPPREIDDTELARITREEPRRLCGHCFHTPDR